VRFRADLLAPFFFLPFKTTLKYYFKSTKSKRKRNKDLIFSVIEGGFLDESKGIFDNKPLMMIIVLG